MTTSRSSKVSPYSVTADYLCPLPTAVARSGSRQLVSVKPLYRNGRDVIEISLFRPLVDVFADLQTACLRRSKTAAKVKGSGDYHSRSIAGVAGELGLHFFAKILGHSARIMLPSLARQPVDHRITVGSQDLAVQSKTRRLSDGKTVNTIYGRFKFFVDMKDDELDYYSFATMPEGELYADSESVTLHLFAFVPIKFIQKRAMVDERGRYITYEDLQASNEALSHVSLYNHAVLPKSFSIAEESFRALTSPSVEDRLIEALLLVDSPIDTSRVLDMVANDADLYKSFTAQQSRKDLQPMEELAPAITRTQKRDSVYSA